ncbi:MAG: DUF6249 domain-containing protein [Bacteroidia bacterium]
MISDLIPIFIFLGAFAMIFGLRYFTNKENMAMIERGVNLPMRKNNPFWALKLGLLLIGCGLGLFFALLLQNFALHNLENVEAIYFSLIGLGGGIGLVVSYMIESKKNKGE